MQASHRVIIGIILAILALSVPRWVATHGIHETRGEMEVDVTRLRAEVEDAREHNGLLFLEIEALSTDPRAAERRAREDQHLAHPNEMILVFSEDA